MTKRVILAATLALTATTAQAADMEMPGQLSWSAYDMGSTGYNQAVAIGSAMKSAYGTNLRLLPGKNDIARSEPLRQGKVDFTAAGIGGVYMAQEGVFEFGAERWGPQKVRVLLQNAGAKFGFALAVTKETCEKAGKPGCEGFTYSDLRGLKVGHIKGSPAINVAIQALLAYGGLTWDDVEAVDFGGYGDSWRGLADGNIDATYSSTTAGTAYEVEAGPRGLYWPPIDASDAEGVQRMQDVAPYFAPMTATDGAGLSADNGVGAASYPYPVLIAMEEQDADLVYKQTRAMVETFDAYKDAAPAADGWNIEAQNLEWLVPFHEGAIRYFKEAGIWTDAAQAHNDRMIARQDALAAAWEELKAEKPADWEAAWAEKRHAALAAGGFKPVF
ncbi:TAXI family TRAP transporter solute-binding subunit [Maritimibacter alkaliphilus]|uniref:TAXI family TRAP transporter solute-binding subunit n=1 Tax=Maritimibacter alkaliphilus TaxID=404236 RepID=UPI001C94DA39|nr:TAXI family TRAP transporter solute-binding subunit [Maritimibacter alkaliphilus]MBY6092346.1 TAXI family TRAP transporter solute-binding subunit [Maritimibacter alkaliphilus]